MTDKPSEKVQDLCNTYYDNFNCANCPIGKICFETQTQADHYLHVNTAAEKLKEKKQ